MLLGMRFFAKKGINKLWKAIETDIRNLYSPKVTPLYVIQEAGKEYLSIIFEIKGLEAFQDFLNSNPTIQTTTRKTRSIPLHLPYYFKLPEDHPSDLQRFTIFLRIDPAHYKTVHARIPNMRPPKDIIMTFFSFSFGDDDLILSILARDEEAVRIFVHERIETIEGVLSTSISRVIRSQRLSSKSKLSLHKKTFLYEERDMSSEREKYERERATMTVIMRLFAEKKLSDLWEAIEKNIRKFESTDFIPLYASQQEAKDYVTVVAEMRNFEGLNELFFQGLPSLINVRKSRTYPLIKPLYFLMPVEHPAKLERYLITIRVEPARYSDVYSKINTLVFPDNVFMTYISYSLGYDDIIMSILAENREAAESFAEKRIEPLRGVISYDVSNQLKTMRLTSRKKWLVHRNRHLSSYDKEYREDYDRRYDWIEDEDYLTGLTGPFIRELRQED